ncbi:MAG TPA: diguanylate cyclase [Holophagaceae bacterium]|nr:diguanylate cyclase [Holophagaceae bacterium]
MFRTLAARLMLHALLIFPLTAAAPAPPSHTPGRFSFRGYGIQDGLGNLAVLALHQDSTGFLWVGTEDGLYRYDGQEFQMFGTADGLPSSYVTDIVESGTGRLWAGTFAGLAVREGGRFVAVGPGGGLPAEPVQDLTVGGGGEVVVALPSGIYQEQGPDLPLFKPLPAWPGGQATATGAGSSDSSIYAASFDGREARVFAFKNGSWEALEGAPGFGSERIDALEPDGHGTLWARDAHHLWTLRPGAARFEAVESVPLAISARALLRVNADGSLYVPTDEGLWIYAQNRWTVLDQHAGLASVRTRDALKDREGSLWVGGQGLSRLLGRGLWRAYTPEDGLPDGVVWTIFRGKDGTLYCGTDRGLAKAGPQGWEPIPATSGQVIRTAVEAPDGTFFLGSLPARVLHWNPRSGRVDAVYGPESGLHGKRLFRLLLDPAGTLWASTEDAGLFRADARGKGLRFEHVDLPGGKPAEYVNGLTLGRSGRIYASGEKGLAVLDHGQWRRYTKADGLKSSFVAYALELRNGEVLVGYFESSGLSRMKPGPDGTLRAVPPSPIEESLEREKVYMLGEDGQGRSWVGTGRGVFVLSDGGVQHFGLRDGLVSEDIDNMAFLGDPGGDVWVGTSGGLARFDAKAYQGAPQPPATVFLTCGFGGKGVDPAGGAPRVPYRQNTLEARFAGLSFVAERSIQYQVRLDGLESEWHVSESQEARYPALAPGSYTLLVRSRSLPGEWGPAASFSFSVLPAWWQTWWFRTLVALAAAGLVLALIRWRFAALRRHNQELEALVHQRTEELESANDALRTQSLTDSLTGLKNRRYLGVCMPEDVAQVRRVHRELKAKRRERLHENVDLAFIMVDLDHFKEVNDTYGHAAGDHVLQQVAEILQGATRDTDTVVRWGGEEFLVVARNAARKDAVVLVERIRSRVESHVFDLGDGSTIRRTCSIGFALMPFLCADPDYMSWEEVVDVADHCLYVAKRSGRDAWVGVLPQAEISSEELGAHVASRLPELVKTPALEVLSSHPDPAGLDWSK